MGTGTGMLFNVNQLTYRQAITDERLLGRMSLRPTLLVEAVAAILVTLPIALSPLRKLDGLPARPPEPELVPPGAPAHADG